METNLENLETPSSDSVTVLPNNAPAKVEFTPEQQAVFDRVLKESHSRIAKQEREESARLKLENQRLKDVASGLGSTDELEKARAEAASARLEAQATLEKSVAQQKDLLIAQEANKHDFVDTATLQALTRGNLRHDPTTGSFIVISDDGTPRLNTSGDPMPVAEFFKQFGDSKPFLVRGRTIPGTGSTGSTGSTPPRDPGWQHYVGPNSNARDANALAQRNPQKYALYRHQAKAAGAIS